jgi:hypothetical protein
VNERFQDLSGETLDVNESIRSDASLRLDMCRWGAKWAKNGKKPYFIGHEREDVVEHRKKLVDFLTQNRQRFYQQTSADEIQWVPPSEDKPITVICHDESTFSSGDQQSHKWSFGFNSAFYDKNRGRSRMLSYFLCQHPYVSLFELSDEEMSDALKKYPELREQDTDFACDSNSPNASMEPGKNKDGYFDNMAVLKQFERLFKMLEFKTVFKNTDKVIFIDNARTHSAKKYDKTLLFKKSGTNCPYDSIEWTENGESKSVSFFFDERKERSKGLFVMCQDLKLIPEDADQKSKEYSLPKLREIISKHPAFDERSNLEILGDKYDVKVMFLPKFHCELNPIESVWCFMKNFVRKRTDQRYETMLALIEQARNEFKISNINAKLWRRFWQAINMYRSGETYAQVIKLLYGARTHEIKQHRQIYNSQL